MAHVLSLVWIAPTQFVKSSNLRQVVEVAEKDGHLVRRKVFESEPGGGGRRQGRPPQRWAKQIDKNLRTLGIRNWLQAAIAGDVWRRKFAEAKSCKRW